MKVIDRLRKMILEELMVDQQEELQDDDELLLSGRIDSLGIVRLIVMIEEDFAVTVPPVDVIIENFMTLTAITTYLEQRLAGQEQ